MIVCVCVCVLESEYPCPLHPPRFISDSLPQSSPWSLFTWFHLPGIPLNLTSTYPSPSHLSRFGSKAASSKKLFSALHHHHHSLAFILYHLLSLVSLSLETPMIFALNPYFPGTRSPVVCLAQDWIHSFRYKKLLDGTCMPMSVCVCMCGYVHIYSLWILRGLQCTECVLDSFSQVTFIEHLQVES